MLGSGESGNEEDRATSTTRTTIAAEHLLERLKVPKPSNLSRKRKIAGNLPRGKRLCKNTDAVTTAVASAMCCIFFWGEFIGFYIHVVANFCGRHVRSGTLKRVA